MGSIIQSSGSEEGSRTDEQRNAFVSEFMIKFALVTRGRRVGCAKRKLLTKSLQVNKL